MKVLKPRAYILPVERRDHLYFEMDWGSTRDEPSLSSETCWRTSCVRLGTNYGAAGVSHTFASYTMYRKQVYYLKYSPKLNTSSPSDFANTHTKCLRNPWSDVWQIIKPLAHGMCVNCGKAPGDFQIPASIRFCTWLACDELQQFYACIYNLSVSATIIL